MGRKAPKKFQIMEYYYLRRAELKEQILGHPEDRMGEDAREVIMKSGREAQKRISCCAMVKSLKVKTRYPFNTCSRRGLVSLTATSSEM